MKLLHYIEIENFKLYGDRQHIALEHPAVLIGPNNCGKTSVLQAIALWSIGLRTWRMESENSKAEKRKGKALNRLSILSVPVPKTRHFWHNLKAGNKPLQITVAVDVKGQPAPVTMIFRHHPSDELVHCEPAPDTLANKEAFEAAARLDVSLLYPMSGISADEAVILPKRIEFLMGRGSTAEVLRNICLQVFEKTPEDWQDISGLMQRLFHVQLGTPKGNEKGGVDLAYVQEGTTGEMDLGLSGRGFQQMLLIFAHLHLHKGSVLLIDEPDAHLEILRQQQVFVLLRDIAHKNGCQVVIVTHSEILLREALDTNLSLILHGRVENLAEKEDIRASLKHFGAEHYVRARETGHVLYVEGGTDVDMLRAFARKLKHPVAGLLEDGGKLNVYYLEDNFPEPERSPEAELQRVEGGYGLSADMHFGALKRMLPDLRGLSIQDNDGKGRTEGAQGGLSKLVWKRYEAENYFISPEPAPGERQTTGGRGRLVPWSAERGVAGAFAGARVRRQPGRFGELQPGGFLDPEDPVARTDSKPKAKHLRRGVLSPLGDKICRSRALAQGGVARIGRVVRGGGVERRGEREIGCLAGSFAAAGMRGGDARRHPQKGLESLIMRHMTGTDGLAPVAEGLVAETPDALAAAKAAGSGWLAGNPKDYDRTYAFDGRPAAPVESGGLTVETVAD